MNPNVNICYAGDLICAPKGVPTHRLRGTDVKYHIIY